MGLSKYKLGELISLCDERNSDNIYTLSDVKGISIKKEFIETKADMAGVSLSPYILVRPDSFAYVTVTSRNGEKITLAHNTSEDTYIVSSSYIVFKVNRPEVISSDRPIIFSFSSIVQSLTAMHVSIRGEALVRHSHGRISVI